VVPVTQKVSGRATVRPPSRRSRRLALCAADPLGTGVWIRVSKAASAIRSVLPNMDS
jgi:hypothetical protein